MAERQERVIETLLAAVQKDEAVRAIFLKGSLARSSSDEYSDVDFYCLVHADELEGFLGRRRALLEQYRPILFWADVNFVGPQVVAVFDDGLHLDFYAVTAEKLPTTSAARVLYDPENLLANYPALPLTMTFPEIVLHFDSFSFALMQIETAVRRDNLVWAHHLVDTLPGDFAFLYRYLYDPDNARLSLKDIDRVLDDTTRAKMLRAAQASNVESTRIYMELMRDTASAYPLEEQAVFNWTFFDFMQQRIEALAAS